MGHFEGAKTILKFLPVLWVEIMFQRVLDLSKDVMWVFVGQRAAKIQAIRNSASLMDWKYVFKEF